MLRSLSIRQPWLELLLSRVKSIEIRRWKPPVSLQLPQVILLHASKTIDEWATKTFGYNKFLLRTGAILGAAIFQEFKEYKNIEEFNQDSKYHLNLPEWYTGEEVGFVFREVKLFPKPIPYKGKLKFFDVNEDILKIIDKQKIEVILNENS